MRRASPSAIAVLPTPGSPISITELARSRWQRISSTCWISLSRPKTGGSLSCRASRFRLVAKCFRNGGSSNRFFSRSSRSSMSRIRVVEARHQHVRLDAMAAQDRHRDALRFLEDRREQVGRFDRLASRAAGVMERQLEDELGRRRDAQLAPGERRHHVQVLFDRLQNRRGDSARRRASPRRTCPTRPARRRGRYARSSAARARGAAPLRSPGRRSVARFRQSCSVRCRGLLRARVLRPCEQRSAAIRYASPRSMTVAVTRRTSWRPSGAGIPECASAPLGSPRLKQRLDALLGRRMGAEEPEQARRR